MAIVGFFGGYFANGFISNPPLSSADCGTWAGAIGTFSATCAAIWLATREDRRRHAENMAAARNSAVSIKWRVNVLHHSLKCVCTNLEQYSADDEEVDNFFASLGADLNNQPIWDFGSLTDLIFLQGGTADILGSAIDVIRSNAFMMEYRGSNNRSDTSEKKQRFAEQSLSRLKPALAQLDVVLVELKKYSPAVN